MNSTLVYPMFAMFCLALVVFLSLFNVRLKNVKQGNISPTYFRTYSTDDRESESALKLSRHFENLFEAPTLFYVVCILAMLTEVVDTALVCLAWAYVLFRAAHAYIHIGNNRLRPRILAYFSGWAILASMWIYLVVGVALGASSH